MDNYRKDALINILQWNSQSLKPKSPSLDALIGQEKIHIVIVSETWLNPDVRLNMRGYNIYRKDRDDSYGGVAIIIHKSIQAQVCPIRLSNVGIEVICIKILNCKSLEHVVSIYCASSVRTTASDWDNIFSLVPKKSLVAGDFNGHHTNWSYKTDQRGIQILDSALEHGFVTLNNGEATRVKLVNGNIQRSSPDITLASSDIAIKFHWAVMNENLGSDHLVMKISMNYQEQIQYNKRRNFKKAKWEAYRDELTESFSGVVYVSNNIQASYEYFLDQVNMAANKHIPMIKICTSPLKNFKPKEYWDPSLSRAVAERRLALAKFRRNPTPDNLTRLEEKGTHAHNLIIKAKDSGWKKFCSSIDETSSVSDMWRKMKWFKGYRQAKVSVSEEKLKGLLYSLTPDSVINIPPVFKSQNDLIESAFTIEELENSLKKKDTAPGNDGITYSMIYSLPFEAKVFLLRVYNDIFTTGDIPKQWRAISVIAIPKAGHDTNTETKLRPISLISCVCKIFHNMIGKRIEWYIEKHSILSPYTVGFRRAQSCLDCISRLSTYIQLGFTRSDPTMACFLDITNAYNNVLVEKVVQTLDDLGIGSRVCRYLNSFLLERYLMIRSSNDGRTVDVRRASRGLAQGDPISPMLFNIITSTICQQIDTVIVSQYADDFVFYLSHKDLNHVASEMQGALNSMVVMLDDMGLDMSPDKSKMCLFSRGRRRRQLQLTINNLPISSVDCVKHLGIWLDRSLLWKRHINELQEKAAKFLGLFKALAGPTWGIHPKHLRSLYISLVRSRIDFGCFLYDNSAKSHLSKLDKTQNQYLRSIGGFIKSSPIHVMEAEMCIPPLYVRRLYLAYKFCIKSMSCSNNVTVKLIDDLNDHSVTRYWHNKKKPLLVTIYNECKLRRIHCSSILDMYSLDKWVTGINVRDKISCKLDCVKVAKRSHEVTSLKFEVIKELSGKYPGWKMYFTDGSKSKSGCGAAYYSLSDGTSALFKSIDTNLSVMTMELVAISKTLEHITYWDNANHSVNQNIVICTDSKSGLMHLARCASGYRGVPIAYVILRLIYELSDINLRLQWVPSHIGVHGNEKADMFAKKAISEGLEVDIAPFYTEILSYYKNICYNHFKEYFDRKSKEKGIWYKTMQSEPPRIPWFAESYTKRSYVVMAHRLRSGHFPSRKFGYLMKKVDSPNCQVCNKIEDVQHLLLECEKNRREREIVMRELKLNIYDVGTFIRILSIPNSGEAKLIYAMVAASLSPSLTQ